MISQKPGSGLNKGDFSISRLSNSASYGKSVATTTLCRECKREIHIYAKVCPFCYAIQSTDPHSQTEDTKKDHDDDTDAIVTKKDHDDDTDAIVTEKDHDDDTDAIVTEKDSGDNTDTKVTEKDSGDNNTIVHHLSLRSKGLIAVVATVLLVLIAFLLYRFFFYMPTIDLNDYISVEFNGENGSGTADILYDEDEFIKEFGGKVKYTGDRNSIEDESLRDGDGALIFFRTCVDGHGSFDRDSGLSNGDTITINWRFDDNNAKISYRLRVKHAARTITVSTLDE